MTSTMSSCCVTVSRTTAPLRSGRSLLRSTIEVPNLYTGTSSSSSSSASHQQGSCLLRQRTTTTASSCTTTTRTLKAARTINRVTPSTPGGCGLNIQSQPRHAQFRSSSSTSRKGSPSGEDPGGTRASGSGGTDPALSRTTSNTTSASSLKRKKSPSSTASLVEFLQSFNRAPVQANLFNSLGLIEFSTREISDRFDKIDQNNDGFLDEDEIRALVRTWYANMKPARRKRESTAKASTTTKADHVNDGNYEASRSPYSSSSSSFSTAPPVFARTNSGKIDSTLLPVVASNSSPEQLDPPDPDVERQTQMIMDLFRARVYNDETETKENAKGPKSIPTVGGHPISADLQAAAELSTDEASKAVGEDEPLLERPRAASSSSRGTPSSTGRSTGTPEAPTLSLQRRRRGLRRISRDQFRRTILALAEKVDHRVYPIAFSCFMTGATLGILTPVIPFLAQKLALSKGQFGLYIASFAMTKIIANVRLHFLWSDMVGSPFSSSRWVL
ncbi:unnamed protein product [Amoebophrya sp. A25]|nr:unnamed protein product [Amoebophrya sp. A25]|eukprot:GSA25T00008357001.1